jgi:hypothetical protein
MIIRVKSHRAYDKLVCLLGKEPQGYYSFFFEGRFYEIPDACTDALQINGVTKARVDVSKLRQCWSTKDEQV